MVISDVCFDVARIFSKWSRHQGSIISIYEFVCTVWLETKKVWGTLNCRIMDVIEWGFCSKYIFEINLTLLKYIILEKLVTYIDQNDICKRTIIMFF